MGKKRQYKDDYTGDVMSIQKRHRKFRVLMSALCVTGIIAAGGATYVLMNPAQTMTKEGIDEMDPNEDFIVADDDTVEADAFFEDDEQSYVQEEDYSNVPLIEEVDDSKKAPADAIPAVEEEETDEASDADAAVLAGGMIEDTVIADQEDAGEVVSTEAVAAEAQPETVEAAVEEVQTEVVEAPAEEIQSEAVEAPAEEVQPEVVEAPAEEIQTEAVEAPAEEIQSEAVEAPAEEIQTEAVEAPVEEIQTEAAEEPAAEIVGVSETEASETIVTEAAAETEEAVLDETEASVAETEAAADETEAVSETEEAAETEAAETEAPETEVAQDETETELPESETQGSEIREKTKDEVYVETEGELLDEKWIDSVGLEIKTEDGWNTAQSAEGGTIEVDADQKLRFRVTYTVQPGTLSPEMKTLIYQIPKEVTSVDESYGEIVDKDEKVIANYAIDNTGVIRVTFTDEIAELNEAGTKVTCKIEFKTQASNLVQ